MAGNGKSAIGAGATIRCINLNCRTGEGIVRIVGTFRIRLT